MGTLRSRGRETGTWRSRRSSSIRFARSELSNGVQLADLLAYSVYRAFKDEDFNYPYFERLLPNFYRRREGVVLDGLKVWPDGSPLIAAARTAWNAYKRKALLAEGG